MFVFVKICRQRINFTLGQKQQPTDRMFQKHLRMFCEANGSVCSGFLHIKTVNPPRTFLIRQLNCRNVVSGNFRRNFLFSFTWGMLSWWFMLQTPQFSEIKVTKIWEKMQIMFSSVNWNVCGDLVGQLSLSLWWMRPAEQVSSEVDQSEWKFSRMNIQYTNIQHTHSDDDDEDGIRWRWRRYHQQD